MTKLWLEFTDESGEARQVLVNQDIFTVGRHSDNDLSLANGKLSREHIEIEHYADVFLVSDCGSSNGTTLNGANLTERVTLKNGDLLVLGGDLEMSVKIASGETNFDNISAHNNLSYSEGEMSEIGSSVPSAPGGAQSVSAASSPAAAAAGGSIPTIFYFIAPAFVVVFLILGGGLFFAFSSKDEKETVRRDSDYNYQKETPDDFQKNKKNSDKTPKPTETASTSDPANTQTYNSSEAQTPVPVSTDVEKVKQNSTAFMRRIAQNDANPFLTQEQAALVHDRIKAIKNSPALLENIKAVKRDSSQFETLAASKNLKPQFLAAAALTGLGAERGSPAEKAKEMLPILSELKVKLDNKLADDNLLMIAAFDQGRAGKYGSLSGKIEGLAKNLTNVSPRQIRTIWFLREKGKITDAEFEFALRFLAIGTIMQNPNDFGVQTEAVTFN